jgi:hypothetical protein
MLILGWTGDEVSLPNSTVAGFAESGDMISPVVGKADTEPAAVSKEVVGSHVVLTRSLFGGGIVRRLLPRVSPVKRISAAVRF